jgi:hypothetical protein
MSLQTMLSTDAFSSATYSTSLVALTNALLLDTPVCRTRLHAMPDDFAARISGKKPASSGLGGRREERVWWSGRRDLNPGPSEPHSDALPGCATPRQGAQYSAVVSTHDATERRRGALRRLGGRRGLAFVGPSGHAIGDGRHRPPN